MKKFIAMVLTVVMALSLVACGGEKVESHELKMGRVLGAAHGTKCFATAVAVVEGDKVVADVFAHLGVCTTYTAEGVVISSSPLPPTPYTLHHDFVACPDLYPAVALTCERLGIQLHATGVESLPLKESDRLRAVAEHRTDADHRMAMALLIAGYEVDDTACISKSYPCFLDHLRQLYEK